MASQFCNSPTTEPKFKNELSCSVSSLHHLLLPPAVSGTRINILSSVIGCFLPKCTLGVVVNAYLNVFMYTRLYFQRETDISNAAIHLMC